MKKFISIVLALAMIFCFAACGKKEEQPAKGPGCYVTIVNAGEIVVANEFVEFEDFDKSGDYNIDEVLHAAHKQFGKEEDYASSASDWGLSITKLWGVDSTVLGYAPFMYYLNNQMVMTDLTQPVVEGERVNAFVFADQATWSDSYTYFESNVVKDGTLTTTIYKIVNDANFNPASVPAEGAEVFLGETSIGKTDAEGKVTYKLGSEKNFRLTVKGEGLVPNVCDVAVQ